MRSAQYMTCLFACAVLLPARGEVKDALWDMHVGPLLRERCGDCHNSLKLKGGLDLSNFQAILKGGERGSAVIPGRPEASHLYQFTLPNADPQMPPGKRKPLTEEERESVKAWIQKIPSVHGTTQVDAPAAASAPVDPAPVRVPRTPAWVPPETMPASAAIDRFIELSWRAHSITPAPRCDDATWVRRVHLDLIGRIPSEKERLEFLMDRRPRRREHLVDRLLETVDHARHLRDVFDVVLMGRRGSDFESRRSEHQWHQFLETAFHENRRWDDVVRELIVARPQRPEDRGAVWYLYERQNNPQSMAESVAPLVYGVQIRCAQCHDHMVAREIKQAHYWGTVAAFNRSRNVDTPAGAAVGESAIGGFVSFANLKKESQPAHLTFFNGSRVDEPWPKDGEKEVDDPAKYLVPPPPAKEPPKAAAVPKFSRREAFAEAVTRGNPLLARAMVNRIWALMMGRGLVHPVDLMDSKHPPSHPDLLDWLSTDFERSGYDVGRLIRNLALTRVYQLDSRDATPPVETARPSGKAHAGPKRVRAQPDTFSRGLEKPLSAEALFRSLLVATGNPLEPGARLGGRTEKELRHAFVAQFPDLFSPEYNATLQQAMFLSNSPLLDELLQPRPGNTMDRMIRGASPRERVLIAFLSVLGRTPATEEYAAAHAYLRERPVEAGCRQLLWALVTGAEFQVNH